MLKRKTKTNLSKSLYLRGNRCVKSLWLYTHKPELRQEPGPLSAALMEEGIYVGQLARGLFPDGVDISQKGDTLPKQLAATKRYLKKDTPVLYEGTFSAEGIVVMADILVREEDGWHLYEVKSSTTPRPFHVSDLAIQHYVIRKAGLHVVRASLIYINKYYVRQHELDLGGLFAIENLTKDVERVGLSIPGKIERMKTALQNPDEPAVKIGSYCVNPFDCEFKAYCWKHVPEESIFSLTGLPQHQKFRLFHKRIETVSQLPADFPLSKKQQQQAELIRSNQSLIIEKDKIQAFLDKLHYPILYLDFEAIRLAVPPFAGARPYEQYPMQYSLHTEPPDGPLRHSEFLTSLSPTTKEEFLNRLLTDLPPEGSIVTYDGDFEKLVLQDLAMLFPRRADEIAAVLRRLADLYPLFIQHHVLARAMNGKYSIKAVLPALLPEYSYDHLGITNGFNASLAYTRLSLSGSEEEKERLRVMLKEYCEMDTLAMVKIVEKLRQLAR